MNTIIILIDIVGIVGFLIAAIFSYKNHIMTKEASNLWLYFATASVGAIIWILSLIVQQFIILPYVIESSIFFAIVFLFTLVAMSSLFDFVKLHAKISQK